MSPESSASFKEEIDIVRMIQGAISAELTAKGVDIRGRFGRLLEYREVLDSILPFVRQRVIDQGHDFDSLDLLEALTEDDGGSESKDPGISPDDDKGGGSKLPRKPLQPIISGSGAVEEPVQFIPDTSESYESLFPTLYPNDPLYDPPQVPART